MSGRLPARFMVPAGGCAEPRGAPALPREIWNRAGLSQVTYRSGDHADLKRMLLARLAGSDRPALAALTARDDADPTIAVLDAAAVLGDIVSFYGERIANECWIATATERRSLVSIGRLIGYEAQPGVAALAWLAFVLEDAAGAPERTPVPAGTAVRTVPASGAMPQTFETLADFTGRPEWNAMRAVATQAHPVPGAATARLLVAGLAPGIRPGDRLLLRQPLGQWLKVASRTAADVDAGTTRVDLNDAPAAWPAFQPALLPAGNWNRDLAKLSASRLEAPVIDAVFAGHSWNHADMAAWLGSRRWSSRETIRAVNARAAPVLPAGAEVLRFRQSASAFGHNAPPYATLRDKDGNPLYPDDWDAHGADRLDRIWSASGQAVGHGADFIELDHPHAGIGPGSVVVLEEEGMHQVATVRSVAERGATGFSLSAKVTRLELDGSVDLSAFTRRGVAIHCESEALVLARPPVAEPVAGAQIALDGLFLELSVGQRVTVSGPRADLPGVPGVEIAEIAAVTLNGQLTLLELKAPLAGSYVRQTARVNGNLVLASHGETVRETLGGGDATRTFQQFTLAQGPVTWLADPASGPPRSTLEVRVNGEAWTEVPSLHGCGPGDRVFITWRDDAGRSTVKFGDGTTGARLPTGAGNVTARYRKGLGSAGLVDAGAVSLLLTRPLGVRSVANPLPSAGAADPAGPDALRTAAPLQVQTLGRVVSVADYRAMALAWPGVTKARAQRVAGGHGPRIRLAIAGAGGATIARTDPLATSLLAALRAAGDPRTLVELSAYAPDYFQVEATLKIDGHADATAVRAAAEAALRSRFALEWRDFGQPVLFSEVTATLQDVPGVLACDVTALRTLSRVVAEGALLPDDAGAAGTDHLARILLLDPRPIVFGDLP